MAGNVARTHEEFVSILKKRNPSLKVITTYRHSFLPIKVQCGCGKKFEVPRANNLLSGSRHSCYSCQLTRGFNKRKNNDTYIPKLDAKYGKGVIKPIEDYVSVHTPIKHICNHKHIIVKSPDVMMHRRSNQCPKCTSKQGYSNIAIDWLNSIAKKKDIFIQHAQNGGEVRVQLRNKQWVEFDGYHAPTKTVYEFYGDSIHGNLDVYEPKAICSKWSTLTARQLHNKTMAREAAIKKSGYKVVSIWENDYMTYLEENN